MSTRSIPLLALLILPVALAAACRNPASGKPRAETSAAKRVAPGELPGLKEKLALTGANTRVGFVGSKVTGSHTGAIPRLEGTVETAGTPERSRIRVTMHMDSVTSDSERLTGHLKSDDFFAVGQHPTAAFVSTEITAGGKDGASHTITGNLTLRGVTRSVAFPASLTVTPQAVKANAEFWINRKEFEIKYRGKADDLIRDEVVIKLELDVARGGI
jgi:polyisoprenoid-binding protein YceI